MDALHAVEHQRLQPRAKRIDGFSAQFPADVAALGEDGEPLGALRIAQAQVGADRAAQQGLVVAVFARQHCRQSWHGAGDRQVVMDGARRLAGDRLIRIVEKMRNTGISQAAQRDYRGQAHRARRVAGERDQRRAIAARTTGERHHAGVTQVDILVVVGGKQGDRER